MMGDCRDLVSKQRNTTNVISVGVAVDDMGNGDRSHISNGP